MEPIVLSPKELKLFMLDVALTRAVFVWGAPGIGKSDVINQFSTELGMECVSILGSQLAPEDLMGVPRIEDGFTRFFPPSLIARKVPYVLFLDELNGCSNDVQKAFYSLILDHRVGEYVMPPGSIVIAAGNRAQDGAITRILPTPLVNRMFHVHMQPNVKDWIEWARDAQIHPMVIQFIQERPNALWSQPHKDQTPFSTPRTWHMLSDAMKSLGIVDEVPAEKQRLFEAALYGAITLEHANQFRVFVRRQDRRHYVQQMLKGKATWPTADDEQDFLVYLIDSFRDVLAMELPEQGGQASAEVKQMSYHAKGLIAELASRNEEMTRVLLAPQEGQKELPGWFLTEVVASLPHLAARKK
jgi:hypothetical protein